MSELYLKHRDEFNKILTMYHLSERAKQALEGLQLVAMVGPTSTGRNTLIRELVKGYNYYFIVSDTTRPPQRRDGQMEQNGVHYFFKSEEEMLEGLRAGEYLEAELIHNQQVSGISIRELEKAKNLNKVAIADVETGGVNSVLSAKPDAAVVMLLPPSFEAWQDRVRRRGQMSETEYRRRLQTAEVILADGLRNPHYNFVIAEDVAHSCAIIDGIVHGQPNPHQGRGIGLIHQLQDNLAQKLASSTV